MPSQNASVQAKPATAMPHSTPVAPSSRVSPCVPPRRARMSEPTIAPAPAEERSVASPSAPRPKTSEANAGRSSTTGRSRTENATVITRRTRIVSWPAV